MYDGLCQTKFTRLNSDHIVLHAGTSDLRTENTASQIAKATIDLATSLKNNDNTVSLSSIVPRFKYVVSLLRNEIKNFYSNIDTKVVIDNRTFWKTVKLLLSEKVTKLSKINLVKDDKTISRDDQIAKKFSEYFISIPILNMPSNGSRSRSYSKNT